MKLTTKRSFPKFGPSVYCFTADGTQVGLADVERGELGVPFDIVSAFDGTRIARIRAQGGGRWQVQAFVTGARGVL